MAICRYFQQGTCKFGKNCRYEHPNPNSGGTFPNQSWTSGGTFAGGGAAFGGGGGAFGGSGRLQGRLGNTGKSIFSAPSNAQSQAQGQGQVHSVSEILTTISQEMSIWQKSKMWPFSCFGYTKNVPCLPGLEDLSPEEVRLKAYEANKSGTASSYQQWISGMATNYANMKKHLENPDATLKNKLVSIIDSWKTVSDQSAQSGKSLMNSGASPLNSGQSTSVFGSSNQAKPVFGSSSVFGNSGQSSAVSSVFGNPGQPPNQSVFGSAQATNQTVFGNKSSPSVFGGQTQNMSQSGFGSAQTQPTPGQSVFGGGQNQMTSGQSVFGGGQNQSTFNQSVFGGGQAQTSTSQSVFGAVKNQTTTQSAFGSGQTSTVFGNVPNQAGTAPSVFGGSQAQLTPAQTAFGQSQANTSQQPLGMQVASTAAFGSLSSQAGFAPNSQPSMMAQPQQITTTPAASATQSGSSFSTFSFANPAQNPTPTQSGTAAQGTGLFGKPLKPSAFGGNSAFGASASSGQSDIDKKWYTPIDQLTDEEKAQFQADSFTPGKIPIRPPPIEMC